MLLAVRQVRVAMPHGPELLCTVASEARRRVRAIGLQRRGSQIVPVCGIPVVLMLPTGRRRQRNHDLGVDAPVREPVGLVRKMRKRDGLRDNASMLRRILLVSGSWHEHPPGHQPTLPACQVHVRWSLGPAVVPPLAQF